MGTAPDHRNALTAHHRRDRPSRQVAEGRRDIQALIATPHSPVSPSENLRRLCHALDDSRTGERPPGHCRKSTSIFLVAVRPPTSGAHCKAERKRPSGGAHVASASARPSGRPLMSSCRVIEPKSSKSGVTTSTLFVPRPCLFRNPSIFSTFGDTTGRVSYRMRPDVSPTRRRHSPSRNRRTLDSSPRALEPHKFCTFSLSPPPTKSRYSIRPKFES